jgi:predicted DNA-binding transcriptional regulator AlpA
MFSWTPLSSASQPAPVIEDRDGYRWTSSDSVGAGWLSSASDGQISRRTFYEWRAKKRAPRCIKLPNGEIRIRRIDLDNWLDTCEEAA